MSKLSHNAVGSHGHDILPEQCYTFFLEFTYTLLSRIQMKVFCFWDPFPSSVAFESNCFAHKQRHALRPEVEARSDFLTKITAHVNIIRVKMVQSEIIFNVRCLRTGNRSFRACILVIFVQLIPGQSGDQYEISQTLEENIALSINHVSINR